MKAGDLVHYNKGVWQITEMEEVGRGKDDGRIYYYYFHRCTIVLFAGPPLRRWWWPFKATRKIAVSEYDLDILNEMEVLAWAAK